MFDKITISGVLNLICQQRVFFYSEADFQVVLAESLAKRYSEFNVYLEEPCDKGSIDIVVKDDAGILRCVIELKYNLAITERVKNFNKNNHRVIKFNEKRGAGGYNSARYSFWKDVSKLKMIVSKNTIGFVIFLTNHKGHWQDGDIDCGVDRFFKIGENRPVVKGALVWQSTDKQNKVHPTVIIENSYNLKSAWHSVEGSEFRYLLLEVK